MPKLSKRRRQLKEIHSNVRRSDDLSDNLSDDQEVEQDKSEIRSSDRKSALRSSARGTEVSAASDEDDKPWVQCNECDKWRSLPKGMDISSLPDLWVCSMNHWDELRASCDAPEENYSTNTDEKLQSFLRVWVKRFKNSDRAESRLPPSAVTRGRKKKTDIDWVKCCNPSCGKWRAIPIRGIDYVSMFNKLNTKGQWKSKETIWYCSMNNWDETTASCAAPQESLYDAPWNLESYPLEIPITSLTTSSSSNSSSSSSSSSNLS